MSSLLSIRHLNKKTELFLGIMTKMKIFELKLEFLLTCEKILRNIELKYTEI